MSIDPKEFAEVQSKLAALTERLAAEETARKAAETEAKEAKEAAANLRRESSRRELSELVVNHRFAFKGEIPEVVDRLERMRSVMSSEDWTAYVDGQKAIHAALSESELLKQHSTEGGDASQTPFEKLIAAKVQAGKSLSEATAETARQNPKLYEEHVRKHNRRIANPE